MIADLLTLPLHPPTYAHVRVCEGLHRMSYNRQKIGRNVTFVEQKLKNSAQKHVCGKMHSRDARPDLQSGNNVIVPSKKGILRSSWAPSIRFAR